MIKNELPRRRAAGHPYGQVLSAGVSSPQSGEVFMFRNKPKVSVIIPLKEINDYIEESIPHILNLEYDNFEILILPDQYSKIHPVKFFALGEDLAKQGFNRVKIIPTGNVGPAEKRDLGSKYAEGEILAFLDDDAYPRKDWLKNAVKHFENTNIAAVGGPAVTPKNDSFCQKISGAVFLSALSGANPERYWPVGKTREINDWPSVNLLVKKSDFLAVGGFDSDYWPGEDTKLCLDLIKKLGKKIIYDPAVFVWHHRRAGLKNHLKQSGNYGIHRGFFAKKFPETSFKLKYFIPAGFFVFLTLGWILLFLSFPFRLLYVGIWTLYILTLVISVFDIYSKIKNIRISIAAIPYIFLTHAYYGLRFIKGFVFTKNLKSEFR